MSCDFEALAQVGVQGLKPYVPGKDEDELKRELGLTRVVKLASNENPLGISAKAKAAAEAVLADLTRYPDDAGFSLKQALVARNPSIVSEQITLGSGSNDNLELLARVFAGPGDQVVFSEHAFAVYPIATKAVGADAVIVPAKEYGHDLPAMAAAITDKTKLVFLANPNNPTGSWFDRTAFEAFMAQVPESVIVVLDEAYGEFVDLPQYPRGTDYMAKYANLVVTRTFSKAWGLAGLRVGYSFASPQVAGLLNRVRRPFNVNQIAMRAAEAVLNDQDYLDRVIQMNQAGYQQLVKACDQQGWPYLPSIGN